MKKFFFKQIQEEKEMQNQWMKLSSEKQSSEKMKSSGNWCLSNKCIRVSIWHKNGIAFVKCCCEILMLNKNNSTLNYNKHTNLLANELHNNEKQQPKRKINEK